MPPTNHRLYWYRIVCHNKVGVSDPGVASKIDLTDEATEVHPNLRPLSLVEAPAPAPSLLEVPSAPGRLLLEASVASRPSKLLAVEAVASLLEAPEAVAPPPPAPRAPDVPSPRPLPKLKRPKRSEPTGGVLDGGVFFTPLKTAKPLPRSKVKFAIVPSCFVYSKPRPRKPTRSPGRAKPRGAGACAASRGGSSWRQVVGALIV